MKLGKPEKPIKITRKNVIKFILAAGKVLDEQGVPRKGRKVTYFDHKAGRVVVREISDILRGK